MRNVVLELTSGYCNSRCRWCFTTHRTGEAVAKGFIDRENVERFAILNRDDRELLSIIPFSHGEALLHPQFAGILTHLHRCGFSFGHIHTNLSMEISDETIRALLLAQAVVVNVGGGTNETHLLNMGTSLDAVMDNLERVTGENAGRTPVSVKMVINTHNRDEVDRLRERVHLVDPSIPVATYPLYFTTSDSDADDKLLFIRKNLERPDGTIDQDIRMRDSVVAGETVEVRSRIGHCPDDTTTVRFDGSVQCCCRSRKLEGVLGNAFVTSIIDIMNSGAYREARRCAVRRTYISYCTHCS